MYNRNDQLQDSLGYLLNIASRTIRRHFNKELAKRRYGITGEHFDVLVRLRERDGQHQQRLAETLHKDKTTMTRLIKSVEELKLVRRVANKNDERQKLVYLTRSGKKMINDITRLMQEILKKAQQGIASSDIAICKNVLRHIHNKLSQEST